MLVVQRLDRDAAGDQVAIAALQLLHALADFSLDGWGRVDAVEGDVKWTFHSRILNSEVGRRPAPGAAGAHAARQMRGRRCAWPSPQPGSTDPHHAAHDVRARSEGRPARTGPTASGPRPPPLYRHGLRTRPAGFPPAGSRRSALPCRGGR